MMIWLFLECILGQFGIRQPEIRLIPMLNHLVEWGRLRSLSLSPLYTHKTNIRIHSHALVYIYIYMCIYCIYIYIFIFAYVHMYMHIYIDVHTYIRSLAYLFCSTSTSTCRCLLWHLWSIQSLISAHSAGLVYFNTCDTLPRFPTLCTRLETSQLTPKVGFTTFSSFLDLQSLQYSNPVPVGARNIN